MNELEYLRIRLRGFISSCLVILNEAEYQIGDSGIDNSELHTDRAKIDNAVEILNSIKLGVR